MHSFQNSNYFFLNTNLFQFPIFLKLQNCRLIIHRDTFCMNFQRGLFSFYDISNNLFLSISEFHEVEFLQTLKFAFLGFDHSEIKF